MNPDNSQSKGDSATTVVNSSTDENKRKKENQIEMNIQHDGNNLSPQDSDENNEGEPIVVECPFIKITKGTGTLLDTSNNHSDQNSLRGRTTTKESITEGISYKSKKKSISRSPKREQKAKHKLKSKDQYQRIKTKFTAAQIEFITQQLKDVIFSAWIGEREYVEKLKAYRDIIEVDPWEDDLIQRLKIVMYGIKGVMEGTKWINITVPSSISSFYCLWVLLDNAPCPGHYWMQITSIDSDVELGLKISVKILREIHAFDGESKTERERRLKGEMTPDEWKEWVLSVTSFNLKALWINIISVITPSNISTGIRLLIVLSVTLVVAFTKCLQHIWDILFRLIREFGIFMHHVTPFAQSVIQFFEKIVGGFYLLLAMMYRDWRQPNPPPGPYPPRESRPLLAGSPGIPRPITYVPPQAWSFQGESN